MAIMFGPEHYRHKDQQKDVTNFSQSNYKLAALRWPERTLMIDNGNVDLLCKS